MTDPSSAGRSRRDVSRWLRVFAGVDEKTLSWVPNERARYTGLGGVVLGTAVIAGLSMVMALSQVLGGFTPWLLLPATVWTLFVLNLDRWLVSSSGGSQWRRRASLLIPRLLIAMVFGVVIAEPLVLRIFQSAVEQHIADERTTALTDYEDALARCNPLPGSLTPASGCTGKTVSFAASPLAVAAEFRQTQKDLNTVTGSIQRIENDQTELDRRAYLECHQGGQQCAVLRGQAAEHAAQNQEPLANLRKYGTQYRVQLGQLKIQVSNAKAAFERERKTAIDTRVAEFQQHQRSIGLLERFAALDELTSADASLSAKRWAIRLFFILIDILPVLVKFFGGTTAYDRLTEDKLASAVRVHRADVRTAEIQLIRKLEADQEEAEGKARRRRIDVESLDRQHAAGVMSTDFDAVDRLAADRLAKKRINGHRPFEPASGLS